MKNSLNFVSTCLKVVDTRRPLEVAQVKSFLQEDHHSPLDAAHLIAQRRIRFIPTSRIREEIEDSIQPFWIQARDYDHQLGVLSEALKKYQPKELLIAVAPFCGGVQDQLQNIQVAMVNQLHTLQVADVPFMIFSLRLDKCLTSEGQAEEIGQKEGVHIVVWGDWSRSDDHDVDKFMPKLLVVHPFGEVTELRSGAARETSFTYRLEPTQPLSAHVEPARLAAKSDLIPLLIGLSFYNKKDYQTAAGVLASVSGPSSDVSIYLAICYLALKDTGKARKSLDSAEKVGNASLEALGDLGTLEANLGDYDKALRDLNEALKVNHKNYKILNNKAIVLAMRQEKANREAEDVDQEKCSEDAIDAIEDARQSGGEGYVTAIYNHAAILLNCEKTRPALLKAAGILKEYLTRNPSDHQSWFTCGRVYEDDHLGQRDAIDCYFEALKLSPASGDYWEHLIHAWKRDYYPLAVERQEFYESLLRLLAQSRLPKEDLTEYKREITSALIVLFAHAGQLREARQMFEQLHVNVQQLDGCYEKLSYRLASNQIRGDLPDPQSLKKFQVSAYLQFFEVYEGELFGHRFDDGYLVSQYAALLSSYPSHIPSKLAKVLLEDRILQVNSSSSDQRAEFIRNTGIPTLRAVLRATTLPAVRGDLSECISDMSD